MLIHTFEVSSTLTNETYYHIQEDLKAKDKSKWKAKANGMDYWGLSDKGIFICMRIIKKKKYYCYRIKYKISARRVIENDNYVGLFHTDDYEILRDKVNNLLHDKSSSFPMLDDCSLSRIDFCVNAYLDNQAQVKAYIRTAKRAKLPAKLEEYMEYDKKSKRTKPTKDDFTVCANDYISVSIYNKYAQMKKQKCFSKSETEKAKNIVRIEIRCMKAKVRALEDAYHISSIERFMERADEIGNKLYKYYLTKMFGKGEICTLKRAKEKIDMSGFSNKTMQFMKEFIEEANESRSAAKAYSLYKQIYRNPKIKGMFDLFDDIDTNYVTVTNKDEKLFGFRIPTPMELYHDFKNTDEQEL